MKQIKPINISFIKIDRYPLNPSTLEMVKFIENGGVVPPIKVATLKQGGYIIKDGRHRVTAYKLLGKKQIKAQFSKRFYLTTNE